MMRLFPILVTLLATTAAAADRPKPPTATAVGKPVTCIPLSRIRQTLVRDDRTIDWVMTGRKIYRTVLPNSCPGLGFEQRFTYETSLSQLCSGDIITVLYQTGPARGASCGLAPFQPVTLTR
jgi:hypothetical protein